jgi:ribosomal-protein-alanine N-acetyltransferase
MIKLFSEIPYISSDFVTLSKVTQDDADGLRELAEDDLVYRYDPTYLFERQFEDVHEAIDAMYGAIFENRESLFLGVRRTGEGKFLGLAEFYDLRDDLHAVSIGTRLIRRCWGGGIATEIARLMVEYLYTKTDIEVICASTMTENAASERALEKAGFIRTSRGVLQDWGFEKPVAADMWFS